MSNKYSLGIKYSIFFMESKLYSTQQAELTKNNSLSLHFSFN